MITEENALFQLGFYVRVRTNVAKRRKVRLLTAASLAKKIFTSAMVKLDRGIADLNIVWEDAKWRRVQCSSRMAKYNEGKWKVRAETGRDELKEPNMKTQLIKTGRASWTEKTHLKCQNISLVVAAKVKIKATYIEKCESWGVQDWIQGWECCKNLRLQESSSGRWQHCL